MLILIRSLVIDHLKRSLKDKDDVSIAYFYFDYLNVTPMREVIAVLLKQLCLRLSKLPRAILQMWESSKDSGPAGLGDVIDALLTACTSFHLTFIILDALDECHVEHQQDLLNFLSRMKSTYCKLYVSSRLLPSFKALSNRSLECHISASDVDFVSYVKKTILEHPEFSEIVNASLLEEVSSKIAQTAHGT